MKNIFEDLVSFYKNHKTKTIILGLVGLLCLILSWKLTLTFLIIFGVYYFWKKNKGDKKIDSNVKKLCPHCKEEVNQEASRCPHCHGKIYLWTIGRKVLVGFILVTVVVLIVSSSSDNKNSSTENVIQTPPKPVVVARTEKCKAPETPIPYSVLEERDRESDVKGIPIHECYILIEKTAPTIAELTSFATVLGKGVENIEFEIFDNKEAYTIDKKYRAIMARNGNDSEISKSDWAIWDVHYIARYLKANTHRRNNYFWTISDIYQGVKNVQISN